MAREVVFVISPDGSEVKAEALGFRGKACEETLKPILDALGESRTDKKPEWNLTGGAGQKIGG